MTNAVLRGGRRTPIAPVHGELSGWHPVELLAHTLDATVTELGVDVTRIDSLFCGCSQPVGAQANSMAAAATALLGWPSDLLVTMVEAGAGSGHVALLHAIAAVQAGGSDAAIACAIEVMSLVPEGATALSRNYGRVWGDAFAADAGAALLPPTAAADIWAANAGWTTDQLRDAVRRRHRLDATDGLIPTQVRRRDGAHIATENRTISTDFHATLSTVTQEPVHGPQGVLTAELLAQMADGAAAIVVDTERHDAPGAVCRSRDTIRVAAASMADPTVVITATERALQQTPEASVAIDEPTAVTALAADLSGLPVHRPGALMTGRAGAVGSLAAVIDHLAGTTETSVVASNLGLGPAIASTIRR